MSVVYGFVMLVLGVYALVVVSQGGQPWWMVTACGVLLVQGVVRIIAALRGADE